MRWLAVVAKNLRLLFRSRETAFTIVFGPLLIILLVSAAYTGGESAISVGTVARDYTPLADEMVRSLSAKGYLVSTYTDESECVEEVRTGSLNTCIVFPDDFRIRENETATVTFAVDYSRINLVYQIIDGLSSEFELQGTEVTEEMAGTVLGRVAMAQQEIHARLADAEAAAQGIEESRALLEGASSAIESVETDLNLTDLYEVRANVAGLARIATLAEEQGGSAIDDAIDALRDARSEVDNETRDMIDAEILSLENASARLNELVEDVPLKAELAGAIVDDAAQSLRLMHSRYSLLVNASEETDARIERSLALLDGSSARLSAVRGSLAHVDASLQESLGLTAAGLASPITTRIEAVSAHDSKLTFTYPYILLLVIMFLGMMLSSTLVVMDKTSRAAFRNFTTATRDEYRVVLGFVTTFLILSAQVAIILFVSRFFVDVPLFANFGVSLIIICAAITLFSFLGMIIGYLSSTQESAMIASLSIGSVLLFVSNLVLPLETMNRAVQALSVYNPYVVLSELLKQSMLFGLRLRYVPGKIGVLAGVILALFLLILAVQRSVRARHFQRRSQDLAPDAFSPRAANPLPLGGRDVRDLFELHAALDAMTRADFEKVVTAERNPVARWVSEEARDRALARKLETRSKEVMILALDKHLKLQTKRILKR